MLKVDLIADLKRKLSDKRFVHTMGVAATAVRLAGIYGADSVKTEMAALLHDLARETDNTSLLRLCETNGVEPDTVERNVPELLHGKAAEIIARQKYGITDEEILDAVKYHTTGRIHMTVMDKIIFIADMTEPGRDFPGVDVLREISLRDLNASVVAGLNSTIRFVLERGMLIHPSSVEARNQLLMSGGRNNEGTGRNKTNI